jgi:hypothetical protein
VPPEELSAPGDSAVATDLPADADAAAAEVTAADADAATQAGRGAVRLPRWLLTARMGWIAGFVVGGVGLYVCYLWLSRTQPIPSDGASNALEAWDMLHGNLLLHGWTLSDVSFYTTELPEYTVVELIRGLGPDVVHVAAAFSYTVLVLLAGLLAKGSAAKGGATGREGVVRVLLAAGIMLAPQLSYVHVLLQSPDHAGTGVPLLLTFLVLDRAPRRWYIPPLVALLLTWVVIGDRIAVVIAVIPLVVVCGIRAYRRIALERKAAWFELSVLAGSLASVGIASLVVEAITRHGGFTLTTLITQFASAAALPNNFWLTVEGVLGLYGADFFGLPFGLQAAIALLHLAGLAVASWAFCRAIRRFFRWDDLIVQVLTLAIVINLAAYLFSSLPFTLWDTRQISAVLPFGAVLAGRLVAADMLKARLVPAMAAVLACYATALGYGVIQPAVPAHDQALADWLVAHHLTSGLSVYDEGNITTLDSGGRVQLRVVTWQGSTAVPRAYQSKASWFDASRYYANFVVNTTVDGPRSVIPYRDIVDTFGAPARTYYFGPYTIMVWNQNLFAELSGPPSPGVGNLP